MGYRKDKLKKLLAIAAGTGLIVIIVAKAIFPSWDVQLMTASACLVLVLARK